jgi:hypothetical protein
MITAGTNSTNPIRPMLKGSLVISKTFQLIRVACMVNTRIKKNLARR